MRVLGLLTLLVVRLHFARCQGFGGGGPSTFGYDASSACSKPYSRNARARFEKLPCDFRQQNWCTVAGNTYPWHAVRRFVRENQGLMRRMYGDEKHINILKSELEKNDVELEFEDDYQRYPEDSRRFDYDDLEDNDPRHSSSLEEEPEGRGFTSRSLNSGNLKLNSKFARLEEFTRPHFYPSKNPTSTTSSTSTTTLTTQKSTTLTEKIPTTTPITPTTKSSVSISPNSTDLNINSTTVKNVNNTETLSATASVTLAEIAKVHNFSSNEILGQIDRFDQDVDELTDPPIVETNEEIPEDEATTRFPNLESIDRIGVPDEIDEEDAGDQYIAESEKQQEFRPRPEYRPPELKINGSSMEGQLFQDVAAKEKQKKPIFKGQGINACPVKEEVVAPFWANNTRGEVLALLNLYPFEQYVHWEKCTHEDKQMYCRDGCKCEQQYRLHRLLAYDPNNECRGIFSDWFKFPSCCLCRCYNLPVEFRVTSRSPRMQKQKVKLRVTRN